MKRVEVKEGKVQCEIYIDSIFLMHFILDFYLLFLVDRSTYKTAGAGRILLGAAVGATFGCSYYLLGGPIRIPIIFRGLIGFGMGTFAMVLSTFRVRSMKVFAGILEKMLLFSFLLGGTALVLVEKIPAWREKELGIWSVLGLGAVGCFGYLIFQKREQANKEDSTCLAILRNGEKQLKIRVLIDSGCKLIEPVSQNMACIIEKQAFEALFDEKEALWRAIPYRSVGCDHGILKGYCLPELVLMPDGVEKKFRNIYVAVSERKIGSSIQMIVPSNLLEA